MHREAAFWLAVVAFSIVGLSLFKLGAATKVGDLIPGYRQLAGAI